MKISLIVATILLVGCGEPEGTKNSIELSDKNIQSLDSIYSAYSDVLESEASQAPPGSRWSLSGMKTSLAMGLTGEIGSLAWGGTRSMELIWKRQKDHIQPPLAFSDDDDEVADIVISDEASQRDLENQLEPLVATMVSTGKVKDENEFRKNLYGVALEFQDLTKAMNQTEAHEWVPYKLRLDLTVSGSGKIKGAAAIIKAGLDHRIRLEWVRIKRKQGKVIPAPPMTDSPLTQKTRELLNVMANEMGQAVNAHKPQGDYKAKVFRVGIGISAKGDIGVISTKLGYTPYVYFKRNSQTQPPHLSSWSNIESADFFMLSEAGPPAHRPRRFRGKKSQRAQDVVPVPREKLRSGIGKALKYGDKVGRRLSKKKSRNKKWQVRTMKIGYKFALSGDIGVVNVKTEPNIEIEYGRNN